MCGFHGDPNNEPLLAAVFVLVVLIFVSLKGFYTTDIQSYILYILFVPGLPLLLRLPSAEECCSVAQQWTAEPGKNNTKTTTPPAGHCSPTELFIENIYAFHLIKMKQKPIFLK